MVRQNKVKMVMAGKVVNPPQTDMRLSVVVQTPPLASSSDGSSTRISRSTLRVSVSLCRRSNQPIIFHFVKNCHGQILPILTEGTKVTTEKLQR